MRGRSDCHGRVIVAAITLVMMLGAAGPLVSPAAAATGVVAPAFSTVQPLPTTWIRGAAVYTYGDADPYADTYGPGVDATLRQAAADGANTVNFVEECSAETIYSTTFSCGWDSRASNCAATAAETTFTVSDACLAQEIAEAHSLGLRVGIYPIVETEDQYNRSFYTPTSDGTATGTPDWAGWWRSYDQVILHYASLAQDYGASLLSVGSELNTADNCGGLTPDICPAQWTQLITAARTQFRGRLYYSADDYPLYGAPTTETTAEPDYAQFPAWHQLDLIGIEGYFPLESGPPGGVADPTVPALVADWSSDAYGADDVQTLADFAATYHRPVIASEMGASDSDYAASEPSSDCPVGTGCGSDPDAQANFYTAFFDVLAPQTWFHGMFAWDFQTNRPIAPSDPSNAGGQVDPRGLPAEQVLQQWWQARASGQGGTAPPLPPIVAKLPGTQQIVALLHSLLVSK